MTLTLKHAVAAIVLMLTISGGIVHAGPLEDGIAAYQRGDYGSVG
jgi:hypothetical protein